MRPKKQRRIRYNHNYYYFKPRGVPLRTIDEVILALDEVEAIRLVGVKKMHQKKAAQKMNVSQSTFQRILKQAHQKIATALLEGKAIRIEKEG
jgi:uncharacterized protein